MIIPAAPDNSADSMPEQEQADLATPSQLQEEIAKALSAYDNLGIANVSDYLNIRETPDASGTIIGRIPGNGACTVKSEAEGWSLIQSGQVEGYVNSFYLLTGEEARRRGQEQAQQMAIITADSMNIRSDPSISFSNVVGQAWLGQRYPVLSQAAGWVQIADGYLSEEYVDIQYALYEASPVDQQTAAINQYENLVISKVSSYLNVRSSPEQQGNSNIIGKMPGHAAGEILETLDGWYHIRSGSIEGYISADPQYTAVDQEARDLAYQSISLMAFISTERLNVRTEPNTEASIWTQISKDEHYQVIQQLDGWAQIELDTGGEADTIDGAYISVQDNNAEVRYALAEAISFSPLEEGSGQQGSLRNRIASYALQFVGNPYVWGGTSLTKGADCSGFVMSVMGNFGVSLPRTSRDQARSGTEISSSEMQPGDLIFYANSSGTVNHVAMYIGNGQIVHASSRRTGIKISSWNYRTPKTIRRVL